MSQNYIDRLATQIRKSTDPDTEDLNEDLPLYRLYAVLALVKGEGVTEKDVHDAWSAWASQYQPTSEDLIPFSELSDEIKVKDRPYAEAIRRIAISTVVQ